MRRDESARLVTLDGLRGIAAIVVMFYHLGNFYRFGGPFLRGYLFVDFFFLLSGFVLALSAEPRFKLGLTTAGFMRTRIARLWPVIAVGAVVGAVSFGARDGWGNVPLYFALALALLPLVRPHATGEIYPLNPPQWSLFFELLGNLLHGVLLRRLSDRALLLFAMFFGVLLVGTIHLGESNTTGPAAANWYFGLPRVGFAYSLGVWMGRCYAADAQRIVTSWLSALMLPLLAVVMASAIQVEIWLVDSLIVLIVFPLTLWIAASTPAAGSAVRLLEGLGALSFPLYAVHLPIVAFFAAQSRSPASAVGAGVVSLACAWLLALALERRRMRRGSATLGKVQTSTA